MFQPEGVSLWEKMVAKEKRALCKETPATSTSSATSEDVACNEAAEAAEAALQRAAEERAATIHYRQKSMALHYSVSSCRLDITLLSVHLTSPC
jgi:hypothetical protein